MKQVLLLTAALLISSATASADRLVELDSQFTLLEAAIAGEAAAADVDPWERCMYYGAKVAKFCNPGPDYNALLCLQYEVLFEEWCKKAEEEKDAQAVLLQ